MYRPRIIPVLLLKNDGLVKTTRFGNERYIGDPINAVRIFNAMQADEIVFLDIEASARNQVISLELIKKVGEEANMPFSVGGGIKTLQQIEERIAAGSEKVILSSVVFENPGMVTDASKLFGSSTLAACMDVKKDWLGNQHVYIKRGNKKISGDITELAKRMEELGIGEIIVQSIQDDGMMQGYNTELIKKITECVNIPVTALGGAGSLNDMKQLNDETTVNGLAAGSLFVYHGNRKGILINYPEKEIKANLFKT